MQPFRTTVLQGYVEQEQEESCITNILQFHFQLLYVPFSHCPKYNELLRETFATRDFQKQLKQYRVKYFNFWNLQFKMYYFWQHYLTSMFKNGNQNAPSRYVIFKVGVYDISKLQLQYYEPPRLNHPHQMKTASHRKDKWWTTFKKKTLHLPSF